MAQVWQVAATAPSIQNRTSDRLQGARLPSPVGGYASIGAGYRLGYGFLLNTRLGLAAIHQSATYTQLPGPDSPITLVYSADSQQVSSAPVQPQDLYRKATTLIGMADLELAWRLHRWQIGAAVGYTQRLSGDMKLDPLSLQGSLSRALGQRLWLIGTARRLRANRFALPGQEQAKGNLMLYSLGLEWCW